MSYVKFAKTHPDAQIPKYQHKTDAGMDLCTVERFTIEPNQIRLVDTGLRIKVAEGYEGQVRPRSGLAAKHGISIVNSPGTIDSGYTGPLKVILINFGSEPVTFMCPDRIAQLVIAPAYQVDIQTVTEDNLDNVDTDRGTKGFGSTGV